MKRKLFPYSLNYSIFYLIILLSIKAASFKTLTRMKKVGIIHPLENIDSAGNFDDYKSLTKQMETKVDLSNFEIPTNYKIENILNTITFDVSRNSCDVKVKERVKFSFPEAQTSLNYLIIYKKNSILWLRC
jgi:hypothetical protein